MSLNKDVPSNSIPLIHSLVIVDSSNCSILGSIYKKYGGGGGVTDYSLVLCHTNISDLLTPSHIVLHKY